MKDSTHPKYHPKATAKCVCGATYILGSTLAEIETEICSACHPFYTGKQKLVDTTGKVDRFRAKMERAKALPEKAEKKLKISASIKAAAATKAVRKSSAMDSKKLIAKVKASREKQELAQASAEGKVVSEKPVKKAEKKKK